MLTFEKEKIVKSSSLVIILFGLGALGAFLVEVVIARYFGVGIETDAYFAVLIIPFLFFVVLQEVFKIIFVPFFTGYIARNDRETINKFISIVLNFTIVILLAITCLGIAVLPGLVRIIAPGFDIKTARLAVSIGRILFSYITIGGLVALMAAILYAYRQFAQPGSIRIIQSLVIIVCVLTLGPRLGIFGLALGFLLGGIGQVFWLLFTIIKRGFSYYFLWDIHYPGVKKLGRRLFFPLFIFSLRRCSRIVDWLLASLVMVGGISILNYAQKIVFVIVSIFSTSIATVILPYMSVHADTNKIAQLRNTLSLAIKMVALVTIPATVVLIVLRVPIVRLLFERGAFTYKDTRLTTPAVTFYSLGLFFYSLNSIIVSPFYALQKPRIPLLNNALMLGINVILALILVRVIGIYGLALAFSITVTIFAVRMYTLLRSEIGALDERKMGKYLLKIAIATLIMGIAIFYINQTLEARLDLTKGHIRLFEIIVELFVAAITFLTTLYLLKIKELGTFWCLIKRRVARQRTE